MNNSGEDAHGKEGAALTIFYDHDDDVVFSMPISEKFRPVPVSFEDAVMKKKFPKQCGFTARQSAAIFKN